MPSTSKKQHNFMLMSLSATGRARLRKMGRKPASKKVAREYLRADRKAGKK